MRDKIEVVHEAASGFLKTLRAGDRGAVVSFADSVHRAPAADLRPALLEQAVHGAVAHGSTALNNAVYIVAEAVRPGARSRTRARRQAIVVLSDGEDTSSLVSFDDVLALARRMGVNIYTVALQSQVRRDAGVAAARAPLLLRVGLRDEDAGAGNRRAGVLPGAVGELKGVYASIATELANQYSIGYAPANTAPTAASAASIVQVVTQARAAARAPASATPADGIAVAATAPSARSAR